MGSSKDSNSDGVKGLEAFLEVLVFLPLVLTCDKLRANTIHLNFPSSFSLGTGTSFSGKPFPS